MDNFLYCSFQLALFIDNFMKYQPCFPNLSPRSHLDSHHNQILLFQNQRKYGELTIEDQGDDLSIISYTSENNTRNSLTPQF